MNKEIGLNNKDMQSLRKFRLMKCGSQWASDFQNEFIWRLKNNIPMELDYTKSREYYNKIKDEKNVEDGKEK